MDIGDSRFVGHIAGTVMLWKAMNFFIPEFLILQQKLDFNEEERVFQDTKMRKSGNWIIAKA